MTLIVQAWLEPLVIPFEQPMRTATRRWTERELVLVHLVGDDGNEGLGEVALAADQPPGNARSDREIAGLSGLDVADEGAFEAKIEAIRGSSPSIAAAVDAAAWDLRARSAGRSLSEMLGVRGGGSVRLNGIVGASPAASAAAAALGQVEGGLDCLKIKAGAEPIGDVVERLSAVRAAVGDDIELRLDLNGSLEIADAVETIGRLAEHRLDYIEDPLPMTTPPDVMARIRGEVPVALAADEIVTGPDIADELMHAGAVDVLVVKPARVGGVSGARHIIRQAVEAGVRIVMSTLFETGIGLAGALHLARLPTGTDEAHGLGTAHLLASDLLEEPLRIVAGRMVAPEGPGLGVTLDAAAIERFSQR